MKAIKKVFSILWILSVLAGIVLFNIYVTEIPIGFKVLFSIVFGVGGVAVLLATKKE